MPKARLRQAFHKWSAHHISTCCALQVQKQEVTAILDSVATAAQYPDDSELTPDSSSDSVAVQEEASHACNFMRFTLLGGGIPEWPAFPFRVCHKAFAGHDSHSCWPSFKAPCWELLHAAIIMSARPTLHHVIPEGTAPSA